MLVSQYCLVIAASLVSLVSPDSLSNPATTASSFSPYCLCSPVGSASVVSPDCAGNLASPPVYVIQIV